VWCCTLCNNIKADMMPEAWLAFMEANPNWWLKRAYVGFRVNGTRYDAPTPRPATMLPKVSDDPHVQAGFANVYKGRLWMLREV
jgi:hypothetical protein